MKQSDIIAFSQIFEFKALLPKPESMPNTLSLDEAGEVVKETIEALKETERLMKEYEALLKERLTQLKEALKEKSKVADKWEKLANDLEVEKGFNKYGI